MALFDYVVYYFCVPQSQLSTAVRDNNQRKKEILRPTDKKLKEHRKVYWHTWNLCEQK